VKVTRQGRPVLGKTFGGHKATQADVDRYEERLRLIAEAPTRNELRDGKLFLVRQLPGVSSSA
jgi:hypothetical protein